jgi:hypothetical protein
MLLSSLLILTSGNIFAGGERSPLAGIWPVEPTGNLEQDIQYLIDTAKKSKIDDLIFAYLYYRLNYAAALLNKEVNQDNYQKWDKYNNEWWSSIEKIDKQNIDEFKKLIEKRSGAFNQKTKFKYNMYYFEEQLYKQLFKELAKDGKVKLEYGPLKGKDVKEAEIVTGHV